jgi:hypothetical protein
MAEQQAAERQAAEEAAINADEYRERALQLARHREQDALMWAVLSVAERISELGHRLAAIERALDGR